MAIRIQIAGNQQNHPGYRLFYVDTIAEIATLPIEPEVPWGSEALCIENSSVWVLAGDGITWKEL